MKKFTTLLIFFLCFLAAVVAQQRVITGKVVDEKGKPVPYVSVKIKNTEYGVAADDKGVFRIKAEPGNVLVFTGGIEQKEFTIGNETNILVKTVVAFVKALKINFTKVRSTAPS